ncbi:hypothetical protein [Streptomyces sp. IB2014 016-6]|uniref:hypothetical protein n=1 Tax=Streptomyces sp. IB2014 016-6 TaxID=2517818 RepID=UPI0011C7B87A|nr:hypothetical protein [Streptomyces sp. IB2014 016-6]TXL84510.1 hypothetical protein EW053_33925 [Streptomyces sp. IB2014 016-6]
MRAFMCKVAGVVALVFALTAIYPLTASASEGGAAKSPVDVQAERVPASAVKAQEAGNGRLVDGVSPNRTKLDGTKAAAWGYQIMPSCVNLAGLIRQGASYWQGATETPGSGKPVECTNSLIDCFGVSAVGCNFGPGRIIMLSTQVSDFALLAAHEFGHEWHPHSAAGCMNWASAYEVMRPTIC